ncbi:HNH endonuclease [Vibrio parahaemolyticus]|uniref:HNH endonuclease n=1 Tax=Vibrio parahaemolyticus TaxID=670 RepID=UPI00235DF899|nr:HNH endonuclease signature motif containing protein [Vibrio parahaemolyticus]
MDKHHDFKFCASYKMSDGIRSCIFEQICEHPLDLATDFENQVTRPVKYTLLHDFILDYIVGYIDFELNDAIGNDDCGREIIEWCQEYGIELMSVEQYNESAGVVDDSEDEPDMFEYIFTYLREVAIDELAPQIQVEVFNLLYADRCFLIEFNKLIANDIKEMAKEDYPFLLKRDGVVNRATYWPAWLKRALFCREKGLCAVCKTDLSSLHHTSGKTAIDHMVPLNLGGVNDATNLQLLCESCNLSKLGDQIVTTNLHPTFW